MIFNAQLHFSHGDTVEVVKDTITLNVNFTQTEKRKYAYTLYETVTNPHLLIRMTMKTVFLPCTTYKSYVIFVFFHLRYKFNAGFLGNMAERTSYPLSNCIIYKTRHIN